MGLVTGASAIIATLPMWMGSGGTEPQHLGFRDFIEIRDHDLITATPKFTAPSSIQSATIKTKPFSSQLAREPLPQEVEALNNIRAFYSLNISELAKVFGVSRPAMYAWLNGSAKPGKTKLRHISLLNESANKGFSSFNRPLGSLTSLIDEDLTNVLSKSTENSKSIDRYLAKLFLANKKKPKSLDEEIAELGIIKMGDLL